MGPSSSLDPVRGPVGGGGLCGAKSEFAQITEKM